MQPPSVNSTTDPHPRRILAVAGWDLDPEAVVEALGALARRRPAQFGLLVPARLHGLEWAGDPHASRPCAERQLFALQRLSRVAGVDLGPARVGDPEIAGAIAESLADWSAQQILLLGQTRRAWMPRPLGLTRRLQRSTGLAVSSVDLRASARSDARRWFRRTPRCVPLHMRAAST